VRLQGPDRAISPAFRARKFTVRTLGMPVSTRMTSIHPRCSALTQTGAVPAAAELRGDSPGPDCGPDRAHVRNVSAGRQRESTRRQPFEQIGGDRRSLAGDRRLPVDLKMALLLRESSASHTTRSPTRSRSRLPPSSGGSSKDAKTSSSRSPARASASAMTPRPCPVASS